MRRAGFGLLLGLFFLLLSLPVHAENEETAVDRRLRALLVSCDHFVTQPDTGSAGEHNLRMLSDALLSDTRRYALIRSCPGTLSSVSAFEEAVVSAFGNAEEKDISLLYISTHGVLPPDGGAADAALVLSDGETEALMDAPTLRRILSGIPGQKVIILDACNSGAFIGKGLSGGPDRVFFTGPEYHVLCSAGGSEASWYYQGAQDASSAGASYFATVLADGLGPQGNHPADLNRDGQITLTEAYAFLTDHYAASTPQVYPQEDASFVLYAYDPQQEEPIRKAVTDITFSDTLLTAGQTAVTFSFTVQRQVSLYYQLIYHENGAWQFGSAQHFPDDEQTDGTVLPGRKTRTLALNTGDSAYGYVLLQLITLEEGRPVFQGARLICVQPAVGEVSLQVRTAAAFVPAAGQELFILAQHDVPCAMSVSVLDENGRVVRRLAYDQPSRPQQLTPSGSTFYWDGRKADGEWAPPGVYTVQVQVRMERRMFTARSEPFSLESGSPASSQ